MATPITGINGMNTSSLLNSSGNNLNSAFGSLANDSLVKFANSAPSQALMFQQAASGSPSNTAFFASLNEALLPAQGQVTGALQLVQSYNARKAQEAQLQQQQQALAASGQAQGALPTNLANPNAISSGLVGQFTTLTNGQTVTTTGASATPGTATGSATGTSTADLSMLVNTLLATVQALMAQGAIK